MPVNQERYPRECNKLDMGFYGIVLQGVKGIKKPHPVIGVKLFQVAYLVICYCQDMLILGYRSIYSVYIMLQPFSVSKITYNEQKSKYFNCLYFEQCENFDIQCFIGKCNKYSKN